MDLPPESREEGVENWFIKYVTERLDFIEINDI